MPRLCFTTNLQRHVQCAPADTPGSTVRDVLEMFFIHNPLVRGYVLDEQGALRRHMLIFVNGQQIGDRTGLTDKVPDDGEVYVLQALSGGSADNHARKEP
jgi:molybdopterin synthase sulfur carrier subunit